jgi:predicted O-linked N-acetylglucosamine transferase (SPINDLY family)
LNGTPDEPGRASLQAAFEHRRGGRLDEAVAAFRAALRVTPDDARLHGELADTLQSARRLDEAIEAYRRAVDLDDRFAGAWYGLGCARATQGECAQAIEGFLRAIDLDPGDPRFHHNLGQALFKLGNVDAALDRFRRAAARADDALPILAIATAIPGSAQADHANVLEARSLVARAMPAPVASSGEYDAADRARPLRRIGYLSAFFADRNWMKPVWGLVNHHDRDRFEVHLFADNAAADRLIGYRPQPGDAFHDISSLGNEDAAARIRAAGIDLLVDLNAYSYVRRLPLLASAAAPVVAGWFNWFATSGLPGVDALIGDAHVIDPEEEPFYTERIVRVPGSYLSFEVGYPVPDVAPPPSLTQRAITFGSLSSQYKLIPELIAAWARILRECPDSRLLIRNALLGSEANGDSLQARFAAQGIPPGRITLEGPAEHYEFLRTYDRIDLALDTFPYNGGTTTAEAIWQGVPVLTFRGDRWASRTSASILRAGGLGEFVADDVEGHIRQAVELARAPGTPARLADLRGAMRARLGASAVCDVTAFAAAMEDAYEQIWRRREAPA